MPYDFHPDAQAELYAQRDYYDSREPGLGKGFVAIYLPQHHQHLRNATRLSNEKWRAALLHASVPF